MYKIRNILQKNKKYDKLIVLDLDETLFYCDILDHFDTFDYSFKADGVKYYTNLRPHVEEFLDYIKENYEYGVYTAATEDYAQIHINELNLNPLFILSRDNCTSKIEETGGWGQGDYYYLKKLDKIKKYKSLDKVIAIDDKRESYKQNYGNLIQIPSYKGSTTDNYLLKLRKFLEELKDIKDIRKVEKRGWLNKYE